MKLAYTLSVVLFLILLFSSIGNASLNVSVSVDYPVIGRLVNQMITATTNERGKGILLVVQPAEGTPWQDFLDEHPVIEILWNMLPSNIRTEIAGKIGEK